MCTTDPTTETHTLFIGATLQHPFPPTIADKQLVSITENGAKNTVTLVNKGDTVIWKAYGDISSIDDIRKDKGNVFQGKPTKQADGSWQGVIGNFPKDASEDYTIVYTVGGVSYEQDPRLKMKS